MTTVDFSPMERAKKSPPTVSSRGSAGGHVTSQNTPQSFPAHGPAILLLVVLADKGQRSELMEARSEHNALKTRQFSIINRRQTITQGHRAVYRPVLIHSVILAPCSLSKCLSACPSVGVCLQTDVRYIHKPAIHLNAEPKARNYHRSGIMMKAHAISGLIIKCPLTESAADVFLPASACRRRRR